MTVEEAEERLRKYIRPAGRDVAVFVISAALLAAVLLAVSYTVIRTAPDNLWDRTILSIDTGRYIFELGGDVGVILCAAVASLCVYGINSRWAPVVGSGCSVDRALMLLDINGELVSAASELEASQAEDRQTVITEHYVFGKNTGCAARKKDICEYSSVKNRGWSRTPVAMEGIRIKLRDGRWYVLASTKVRYSDYHSIEHELDAALVMNRSAAEDQLAQNAAEMI
ncbi:MAG: hypothetical protein J5822_08475 [Eubacteriaceae bacterium]|nr:hypothetical protein [Eubacteriaceae bacterium]